MFYSIFKWILDLFLKIIKVFTLKKQLNSVLLKISNFFNKKKLLITFWFFNAIF
jgi:hypothetical protein